MKPAIGTRDSGLLPASSFRPSPGSNFLPQTQGSRSQCPPSHRVQTMTSSLTQRSNHDLLPYTGIRPRPPPSDTEIQTTTTTSSLTQGSDHNLLPQTHNLLPHTGIQTTTSSLRHRHRSHLHLPLCAVSSSSPV